MRLRCRVLPGAGTAERQKGRSGCWTNCRCNAGGEAEMSQHLIQTPDTLVLRVLGEIIRSIEAEFEEEEKQYRGVKYSQMRR